MNPMDILRNWRQRQRTPAEIRQDEITKHNAEVERKKAEKARRKESKRGRP